MNSAGQKVILLIEDDTLITVSLASTLQKSGYAVISEDSGERGVETALTNLAIDLVLMDIMLGTGINGIQAARQILNERSLPIIFLTATTDPELVEETTGIPAYGFVHKSSGKAILVASVNMALRLFDAQLEERRKDAQLKMAEANFETVFQRSPALMVISNMQTEEIVAVNEAVIQATGRSYEELVGKKTSDLEWASLDDQRRMTAILAAEGRVKGLEVTFHPQNMQELECIFNLEVVPFRGEPHLLSVIQNISERKQAERALEATEVKVRTVFNTMEEGMALNELVFDSAGEIVDYRILDVNTAFEQIATLSREQAVGKLATEIYYGMSSEGINQFWKAHYNDEHSIKTDMYVEEIQRWRHISTSKPVNNRFVTLFFDNTEQKAVEEQLRRSLQEKETLLRELYHRTKNNMAVIIAMLNLQAMFCRRAGAEGRPDGCPGQNSFDGAGARKAVRRQRSFAPEPERVYSGSGGADDPEFSI